MKNKTHTQSSKHNVSHDNKKLENAKTTENGKL